MIDTLPPFKRHQEGARLYYDVLSSKKDHYYEVTMLGNVAISCECVGSSKFHQRCEHKKTAEKAETEFQEKQRGFSTSEEIARRDRMIAASLSSNRPFKILR